MDKNMIRQALYGSFRRLGNFPLDPSSYFRKKDDVYVNYDGVTLDDYLSSEKTTAYVGQQLLLFDGNTIKLYLIGINKETNKLEISDKTEIVQGSTIKEIEEGLNTQYEEFTTSIDTKLEEITEDITGVVAKDYVTKNELKSEIDTIIESIEEKLGEFLDGDNEGLLQLLDSLKALKDWSLTHKDEFTEQKTAVAENTKVIASNTAAITNVDTKVTNLTGRVNTIQGKIDQIEHGALKDVLQVIELPFDTGPEGSLLYNSGEMAKSFYSSETEILKSNDVIQSIRIRTESIVEELKDFTVYICETDINGNLKDETHETCIELIPYRVDISDPAIGEDCTVYSIEFNKLNELYEYEINHIIEADTVNLTRNGNADTKYYKICLSIAIGSQIDSRCIGTLWVNYYRKA